MSVEEPFCRITPATEIADLELLRPVLESAVCNPFTHEPITSEIDEVLTEIGKVCSGETNRYYAAAVSSGGLVLGVMGLQTPGEAMQSFVTSNNPQEIINAFVLRSGRGRGIGRMLVEHLQDKAQSEGRTELVLNSGPRYMLSGWPFWRKMYGEPVGKLMDYYGPGYHAPVWRTDLPRARQ